MEKRTLAEGGIISSANFALSRNSGSTKFITVQNDSEIQQLSNSYPNLHWNDDIENSTEVPVHCEQSGFVNSKQNYNSSSPGISTSYCDAKLNDNFSQNVLPSSDFQGQQQFITETYETANDNRLSHPSHLSLPSHQAHMDSFQSCSLHNTNSPKVSNPQSFPEMSSKLNVYPGLSDNEVYSRLADIHATSTFKSDNTEKNVYSLEEKKLITTPLPSDAEKMSSSSSSASSISVEEISCPDDPDYDVLADCTINSLINPVPDVLSEEYSNYGHLSYDTAPIQNFQQLLNAPDILLDEDMCISLPENVIEIGDSAYDYHLEGGSLSNGVEPISSSLSSTSTVSTSSNQSTDNGISNTVANHSKSIDNIRFRLKRKSPSRNDKCSTWIAMKEDRRKRKLKKTMKLTNQLAPQASSAELNAVKGDICFDSHKEYRHKHHSKYYQKASDDKITEISLHRKLDSMNTAVSHTKQSNYSRQSSSESISEKTYDSICSLNWSSQKQPSSPIEPFVENDLQQIGSDPYFRHASSKNLTTLNTAAIYPVEHVEMNATSHYSIAPLEQSEKLCSTTQEHGPVVSSVRQWQTVTAIQDPKLPPALSEKDRIPKRGRPSKKMSEINLKYKPSKDHKLPVSRTSSHGSLPSSNSGESAKVVAMYTIGESGFKELDNKTKQTQKSLERAAAFRGMLSEISKNSSIQKKTAAAKDVVGAFKAVGVRTRKQASNRDSTFTKEKTKAKRRSKVSVVYSENSNKTLPKNKVNMTGLVDHGKFTFSELAKQFKISDSILYRAMEQSQRNSIAKRKPYKQKEPQISVSTLKSVADSFTSPTLKLSIARKNKFPSSTSTYTTKSVDLNNHCVTKCKEVDDTVLNEVTVTQPTLVVEERECRNFDLSIIAKLKKKKKRKKEKDRIKKKKKHKEKRKKSKLKEKHREASNCKASYKTLVRSWAEVQYPSSKADKTPKMILSSENLFPSITVHKKSAKLVENTELTFTKHNNSVSKTANTRRSASTSSLSACEDAFDVAENSSDVDVFSRNPDTEYVNAGGLSETCKISSKRVTAPVFGSGITSAMPSFHGIKEHGGFVQFSESNMSAPDGNFVQTKKHKHKKKKADGRLKNASDPEFLSKLENVVSFLEQMKLSSTVGFLPTFTTKPGNIFAATDHSKRLHFSSAFGCKNFPYTCVVHSSAKNSLPSVSNSALSLHLNAPLSCSQTTSLHSDMSTFCRSEFFKSHGFVKPFNSSLTASDFSLVPNTFTSKVHEKVSFTKGMPSKPLFAQPPTICSFLQSAAPDSISSKQVITDSTAVTDSMNYCKNVSPRKSLKRKRGWPKGKPRGSKLQKSSLEAEILEKVDSNTLSTVKEDDILQRLHTTDKTTSITSSKALDKSLQSKACEVAVSNRNVSDKTAASHKKKYLSEDTKLSESALSSELTLSESLSAKPATVGLNHALVDHIKAAISEKLTSHVCSDTVANTVDVAVASYLRSLVPDSSAKSNVSETTKRNSLQIESSTLPSTKQPRRRGRPPKLKASLERCIKNTPSTKTSDKHPKKVWASMHQDASTTTENRGQEPKKRGPGRPRKNKLNWKPVSRNVKLQHTKRLPEDSLASRSYKGLSSRRSGTFCTPKVRLVKKHVSLRSTSQRKRRCTHKNPSMPKLTSRSLQDVTELSQSKSIISSQKAKLAVSAVLSQKQLEQNLKSTARSACMNMEPCLNNSTEVHKHIDDSTNRTAAPAQNEKTLPCFDFASKTYFHSLESSQKSFSKKNLETVVTNLKNKQTNIHNDVDLNCSTNQCSDVSATQKIFLSNNKTSSKESCKFSCDNAGQKVYDGQLPIKRKRDISNEAELYEPPTKKAASSFRDVNSTATDENKRIYLRAGLFSNDFKQNGNNLREVMEESLVSCIFPPPKHAGMFLRKSNRNFQLPHNIWKDYQQGKLHPTQNVSTHYRITDQNIYVDTPSTIESEEHVCDCSVDKFSNTAGCGKECLNRLMHTECSSLTCPCRERCSNQSIRKKNWWKNIERFKTHDKGWGLRTTTDIPEGEFIMEYVGEVVSDHEFRHRIFENYDYHRDRYCAQIEVGKIIDAHRIGNLSRFVNHSCEPNCEMQRWISGRGYHLCLFSKRTVAAGTELTFDYSSHFFDLERPFLQCKCGSSSCRGLIGGKTSVFPESSLNRRSKVWLGPNAKKKPTASQKCVSTQLQYTTIYENQMQPISAQEKAFIKQHRPFLFRNLNRIKREGKQTNRNKSKELLPLTPGGKKEDKIEVNRNFLLYETINEILTLILSCKDENGVSIANPFINLLSKHNGIKDPVDLSFVQDKIMTKQYENFEEFSADVLLAFRNAEKHFGKKTSLRKNLAKLRRVFTSAKNNAPSALSEATAKYKNKAVKKTTEIENNRKNSDYIRCICGIYRDEGTMIQCEKCYVWQHCECMKVNIKDYNESSEYLCEECDGRDVEREVEMIPQPPNAPPGHTYFLTLQKDKILVKQGDCARIVHDHCLRRCSSSNPPVRTSFRLQSHSTSDRMDFFRIEKLWTDDNGDKFAYGHHFVRPQDTKHSEGRLFFSNELIAAPFHEIVPLDAVVSLCCVMDLETYRKGMPKDFQKSDLYICQHRCDLSLRIVNKAIKKRFPICTKAHVFNSYSSKLVIVRKYQVPDKLRKTQARRMQWMKSIERGTKSNDEGESSDSDTVSSSAAEAVALEKVAIMTDDHTADGKKQSPKEKRLNGILTKLKQNADQKYA